MGLEQREIPKISLVSLNDEFKHITEEIIQAGGDLGEGRELRLDSILLSICQKADAYGVVQEQLEKGKEFWKYQKDKCAQAEKTFENGLKKLRDRMKFVLSDFPKNEIQGELYRFFLSKSADRIEIDETQLPKAYFTTEIRLIPNKEMIQKDIDEGKQVPGVSKIINNTSLRSGRPK